MIFDDLGLPRDTGATDWGDSARAAGVLKIFAPELMDSLKIDQYLKIIGKEFEAMRHPREIPSNNWKNFTRDQLICYTAGLKYADRKFLSSRLYQAARNRWYRAQNTEKDVVGSTKTFPDGPDLLTPSHMNHLRMCSGLPGTWYGKCWLVMDILYHSFVSPLTEPNQLLCMCMVAGPKYIRLYKKTNSKWKQGITDYWSGWRQEDSLAQKMIQVIDAI